MRDPEAPAWWAGVEHLREGYERRDGARRDREDPPPATAPASARPTVVIRGQTVPGPTAPRLVEVERRRPPRRPVERVGPRPDRIAMWALLMGILLILVAVGTADAAVAAALVS